MTTQLRILLVAAVLGTSIPGAAAADPVTITSGLISVPGSISATSPIQLEGTDGMLPFSFAGFISASSTYGARSCTPCLPTATSLSLAINTNGLDLTGMVTYGDDHYFVGSLAETFGNVLLEIGGLAVLPPAPTFANQLTTIMAPFQISRAFFTPPSQGGPFGPGNALIGSGIATISLFAEVPGSGAPVWSLRSADYRFGEQAPIPEPSSVVLVVAGLVGLAVQRRKTRRLNPQMSKS